MLQVLISYTDPIDFQLKVRFFPVMESFFSRLKVELVYA